MNQDEDCSVTRWIGQLKRGHPDAAHHLWQRYFPRIVGLARAKLGHAPRAFADEEDAALSAFRNLCEGAAHGQFDLLQDRDDLWRLLVVITVRKAADLKKRQNRVKRGGGRILGQSDLDGGDKRGPAALELIAGDEPTPVFLAELAEEFRRRLDQLGDVTLRQVALLRLEGYDYDEIAERLGVARRTVARKLEMIRDAWDRAAGEGGAV
jgi:DNA-directed RNA polymerase specialized sigma24 family protein